MITFLGSMEGVLPGDRDGDRFEAASSLGLDGIEVDLKLDELGAPGRERLRELDELRRTTEVRIPSFSLGALNEGGLGHDDPAVREAAITAVKRAIDWAGPLGAEVILIPFFFKGSIRNDEAARDRTVNAFRELCPSAERLGVTLAYEGDLSAADITDLARRVESKAFGCYYDFANAVWLGYDPAAEIRELESLLCQVHMKEAKETTGDARPGEGRVDFRACARALTEIDYSGWMIMETPPGTPDEVARDIAFTREVFPDLKT